MLEQLRAGKVQPPPAEGETAWLIEWPSGFGGWAWPHWLAPDCDGIRKWDVEAARWSPDDLNAPQRPNDYNLLTTWTRDANEALRFGAREDAEAFLAGYRGFDFLCVTEHHWPEPSSTRTQPMPDRDIEMRARVEVIQADRDAAWPMAFAWTDNGTAQRQHDIQQGKRDNDPLVQAFARHRLAAGREEIARESDEAEFELCQGDDIAAHASGPRDRALAEIMHYAAVYGQDGPVEVFEIIRKPVALPTPKGTPK